MTARCQSVATVSLIARRTGHLGLTGGGLNRTSRPRRGPRRRGIVCEARASALCAELEVKRHAGRLDLPAAVRQAEAAAGPHDLPVVCHRRDGEQWQATLPLTELLELLAWREQG